jgi:hypothetical protein
MRRRARVGLVAGLALTTLAGLGAVHRATAEVDAPAVAATVIQGSGASDPAVQWGGGSLEHETNLVGVIRDGVTGRRLDDLPVTLQVRAAGASEWSTFVEVRSEYGVVRKAHVFPDWSSEFRWSFAGNATAVPASGEVFKVSVTPRVNLCCGGQVKVGKSFSMNGILGPRKAGLTASLQLKSGTSWKNVATCKTNSEGICALKVSQKAAGSYSYRLHRPADALLLAATSRTATVKVVK